MTYSVVAKVYNQIKVQTGWVIIDASGNLSMTSKEQAKDIYLSGKVDRSCPFNGVQITSNSYNANMFKVYIDGTPITDSRTLFVVNSICKEQNGAKAIVGYTVLKLTKDGLRLFRHRISDMKLLSKSYIVLNGRMMSDGRVVPKTGQFNEVLIFNTDSKKNVASEEANEWNKYCDIKKGRLCKWWAKSMKVVTLPQFIVDIDVNAFAQHSEITKVVMPDSVKKIGRYAFSECSGLTSVDISNNVTLIDNQTFFGCTGLTGVKIPESVTKIGNLAFANCTGLQRLNIPESVTLLGNSAFANCRGLQRLNIPESVTSIGSGAFSYCKGLRNVVIEDGVTSIGDRAFCDCSNLSRIQIPVTVTSIGENAFEGCNNLEVLLYEGSYAERYCNEHSIHFWRIAEEGKPESMTFPNVPITVLDEDMMESMFTRDRLNDAKISVLNLDVPHGVQRIGNGVFEGWNIETVTVPNTVTDIGICAFKSTNIRGIVLPNSVKDIGDSAFALCRHLKSVEIPRSVIKIDEDVFASCWELEEVTLSEGLKEIGAGAFDRCRALRSIVIPRSVEKIGEGTFDNCSNLGSITILNPTVEIVKNITYCKDRKVDLVIKGYKYSTAERYCKRYDIRFQQIASGE